MDGIFFIDREAASVVVIDDDGDSLDYLSTLLARSGIRCVAFERSQDALAYIRSRPVSVVVTDVFMPEIDGMELIAAIKNCRQGVAVIALSGHDDCYLRCMKAYGAVAGMRKPVDPEAMLTTVDRYLGATKRREYRSD